MGKLYSIDLDDINKFTQYMTYDNCDPITIAPDPAKLGNMVKFVAYCKERNVDYYLVEEKAGQIHYHGLIIYPNASVQKRTQVWISKNIGKYFKSKKSTVEHLKLIHNVQWYEYCHKQQDQPELELDMDLHPQDNMNANIFME